MTNKKFLFSADRKLGLLEHRVLGVMLCQGIGRLHGGPGLHLRDLPLLSDEWFPVLLLQLVLDVLLIGFFHHHEPELLLAVLRLASGSVSGPRVVSLDGGISTGSVVQLIGVY